MSRNLLLPQTHSRGWNLPESPAAWWRQMWALRAEIFGRKFREKESQQQLSPNSCLELLWCFDRVLLLRWGVCLFVCFSNLSVNKAGSRKDETLVIWWRQHFCLHFGGGFSLQGGTKAAVNIVSVVWRTGSAHVGETFAIIRYYLSQWSMLIRSSSRLTVLVCNEDYCFSPCQINRNLR